MKKRYQQPLSTIVGIEGQCLLLTGSNLPEEQGGGLHWRRPDNDDSFDEDDEIA